MVAAGAIAVSVLVLVFGILMPLHSTVSNAVSHNETKREDLKWMRVNAAEVRVAGNQLPADTVAAKRAAHKHGDFADFVERAPLIVLFDGNVAADPIAHFGNQDGMSRIELGRKDDEEEY